MNIYYIQAFAKQVHTMLIKPIDTRESSLYFSEYLSCVSVAIFLQLHTTVNQPAQKGAGRGLRPQGWRSSQEYGRKS